MNKILRNLLGVMTGLLFAFSLSAQCEYTLTATDSFGDSWQQGFVEVYVNGALVLTFNGAIGAGPTSATFDAAPGDIIDFTYTDGTFDGENDLSITDCTGAQVFSGNMGDFDSGVGTPTDLITGVVAPEPAAFCSYLIEGTDSFGDGWNGFTVSWIVDGAAAGMFTFTGGAEGSTTFNAPLGSSWSIEISADGTFPTEVGLEFFNWDGTSLAAFAEGSLDFGAEGTVIASGTSDCPAPEECALICPSAGSGYTDTYFLQAGDCEVEIAFPLEIAGDCGPALGDLAVTGFTDIFALDAANVIGCVEGDDSSITLTGFGDDAPAECAFGTPPAGGAYVSWVAPVNGEVCFDFAAVNNDALAFFDFVSYYINGAETVLAGDDATGSVCVTVAAGDEVGFGAYSDDAFDNGIVGTFSNFSFTEQVELADGPYFYTQQLGAGLGQIVNVTINLADGTVLSCDVPIDVYEYSGPVTSALACNDQVNISVDEDCMVTINADMFLEGGPYECYDNYCVRIRPFGGTDYLTDDAGSLEMNGLTLNLPAGQHIYEVVDCQGTGNTCWGYFLIEDKFAPTIECACEEGAALGNVITLFEAGDLSSANGTIDPVIDFDADPAVIDCAPYTITGADLNSAFAVAAFEITEAGEYTIEAPCGSASLGLGVYLGAFDETDACVNAYALGGTAIADYCGGGVTTLTTTYEPGIYSVVVYTFDGVDGSHGEVSLILQAPDETCAYLCYDENNPEVLANLPTPTVVDNCGAGDLAHSDVWTDGECGERILTRTWLVTDPNGFGTATCVQEFLFGTIGVGDILLPPDLVQLDCGGDASPEGIAAGYGITNAYPYYYTSAPDFDADGNQIGWIQVPVAINNSVCNLFASYTDVEIPACGPDCPGNKKVIRNWNILDWCTGETTPYVQIIKATDGGAPEITAPDITVSVNPWNCAADFYLPCPEHLHDDCYGDLDYTVEGPAGVSVTLVESATCETGYVFVASGAPKTMFDAPHVFTYIAEDCCGNVGTYDINVTVLDNTPPVAIAKENIVISLTGSHGTDGVAKMYPESVDNGSHDGDCGPVYLEIRREDGSPACGNTGVNDYNNNVTFNNDQPPFAPTDAAHTDDHKDDTDNGEFVKFCCEDINEVDENGTAYGLVKVILRVWDDGNMSGNFGDWVDLNGDGDLQDAGEQDNYSDTWAWVRVEDKLGPSLVCPADITLKCNDDYTDTNITGQAWAQNTCSDIGVTYTDDADIDVCGAGIIYRTWCVEGTEGTDYCCVQTIVVDYFSTWDPCDRNAGIQWPRDYTGESDPADPWCGFNASPADALVCRDTDTGEPEWTNSSCDLIGHSLDSDTFYFEDGACYKVLNNWTVINWCIYNPNDADWNTIAQSLDNDGDGIPNLWDNDDDDSGNPDMYYTSADLGPDYQFYIDDLGGLYWVNYGLQQSGRDYTVDIWDLDLNGMDNGYFGAFDPELEDDGVADGYYTHLQIVKLIDDEAPEINTGEEPCFQVSNEIQNAPCTNAATQLNCEAFVVLNASAVDSLSDCPSDWIKWEVFVDVWGDWTYDYEYSSFIAPISSNCPFYLEPTSMGEEVEIRIPDPIAGSKYKHRVLWKATDGCGNVKSHESWFTVEDKKDPTPYCINLSTALMENGNVELWACDFDAGAFDDCTPQEWLAFTFEGPEEGYFTPEETDNWDPETRCQGKWFTCSDLDNADADGLLPVKIYVWDECGNVDFCLVNLRLVDNNGACGGTPGASRIAGDIRTEGGEMVEGVQVENMNEFDIMSMEMTDDSGHYEFDANLAGMDYELEGKKNDDYLNGVSTLDLVLIQKHILGLQTLDSPYKLIAADASNDERITAIDLVQLRKLILGIYDELPNNDSWRFVDADVTLDTANPWPFAETILINDLVTDMMQEDFVGVKVGDVNGSVVANLTSGSTELRRSDKLTLNAVGSVSAGENVTIEVTADNFDQVYGFQFTMNTSGMQLTDVQSGAIEMTNENVGVIKNQITVSWNSVNAVSTDDVLFTLTFTSAVEGTAGDLMSINSTITNAEAYVGEELTVIDVELTGNVDSEFALMQNEPNPFNNTTLVGFVLPENGQATLTVYDVTGKVMSRVRGEYTQGYNEIELSKKDINISGVLYYKLESGDYTATKKMIILD